MHNEMIRARFRKTTTHSVSLKVWGEHEDKYRISCWTVERDHENPYGPSEFIDGPCKLFDIDIEARTSYYDGSQSDGALYDAIGFAINWLEEVAR